MRVCWPWRQPLRKKRQDNTILMKLLVELCVSMNFPLKTLQLDGYVQSAGGAADAAGAIDQVEDSGLQRGEEAGHAAA